MTGRSGSILVGYDAENGRNSIRTPLHRVSEFGELTSDERAAVEALQNPPKRLPRNAVIRAQNTVVDSYFRLLDGWALASMWLPEGQRQILKVHLPGDALGTPSMSTVRAVEELAAVTEVVVAEIPFDRFGRLYLSHPRLAARFLLSVQRERVSLMDQITAMGRATAECRLAGFLLDLLERLEAAGLASHGSFDLPLTQQQVGDVLGLTSVHVNRMFKELRSLSLIGNVGSRLTVLDRAGLFELAGRPRRELRRDPSWLPHAS